DGGYTAMSQITVVPPRSNLVRNDEFDDGMAEWDLRDWTDGGGSTWSVIQDSTVSGPNAAHIAVGNSDDSKWKIQLQQHLDFRLQEGKTYQISFMARAESPRKIRATFSGAPSNTVYWSSGDVQLSTASQVYGPFEYTCDDSNVANDSFFIFDFYLAFGIESDVWIDKVTIVDKGGSGDVAGVNVAPLMASVQA